MLREMGVNHLQGFLISKPLSATDIVAFLEQSSARATPGTRPASEASGLGATTADADTGQGLGHLLNWPADARSRQRQPSVVRAAVPRGELADRLPD